MKKIHNESIFNKLNSFSDIVQVMVDGVRKEWVKIDMSTFGRVRSNKSFFGLIEKTVCYGCAATNTLCQLMGEPFTTESIDSRHDRASKVNYGIKLGVLHQFEIGIDDLREGNVEASLKYLKRIESDLGFILPEYKEVVDYLPTSIFNDEFIEFSYSGGSTQLPYMGDRDLDKLKVYEEFAKNLRAVGL